MAIGKQGGACLLTLINRKTRFTLVAKCENKSASAINSAMLKLLQNVPSLTITPDRKEKVLIIYQRKKF